MIRRRLRRHLTRAAAFVAVAAAAASGCALPSLAPFGSNRRSTRIISYNVQNLFDDRLDGGEYDEYRPGAGWDRGRYYARLERIDRVVRGVSAGRPPDILVLQEIESARVAHDLANDVLRRYRHVSAGASGRTTTQVVVLSRDRPASMRAHRVSFVEHVPAGERRRDPPPDPGPGFRVVRRGRDLLELSFPDRSLHILAAHWKSQSGGEATTEPMRIAEARLAQAVVASRDVAEGTASLLIGDLNEDLYEGRQHGYAYETALVERGGAVTLVDSPPQRSGSGGDRWFRSLWGDDSGRGTYWYRGEWERLDHAFLRAGPRWRGSLRAVVLPEIVSDAGTPLRYDPRTGRGYSDHLPILVDLERLAGAEPLAR
ncbi:MAG: endonuclease/exonuclease/phosphatase family protein [Spirochaetota bacterium]